MKARGVVVACEYWVKSFQMWCVWYSACRAFWLVFGVFLYCCLDTKKVERIIRNKHLGYLFLQWWNFKKWEWLQIFKTRPVWLMTHEFVYKAGSLSINLNLKVGTWVKSSQYVFIYLFLLVLLPFIVPGTSNSIKHKLFV